MNTWELKASEASKSKMPPHFELNNMRFHKQATDNYNKLMRFYCHFDSEWARRRLIVKCPIEYDETVNSIIPQRIKSKRAGKHAQHTYLVAFHKIKGIGYAFNTRAHFNKVRKSDIKKFKAVMKTIDSDFDGHWIKDARTWGSSSAVPEMYETTNKTLTMGIERRFGWVKNAIYRIKKTIKTQDDLEKEYIRAFAKYCIIVIN